jgi:hypothetical protein
VISVDDEEATLIRSGPRDPTRNAGMSSRDDRPAGAGHVVRARPPEPGGARRLPPPPKEQRRVPGAADGPGAWISVESRGLLTDLGPWVIHVFEPAGACTGTFVSTRECVPVGGTWPATGAS